jgi:hypothetical protein
LKSWTERERADKFPGVKTEREKKRIIIDRPQGGGNRISVNLLK